MALKRQQIIDKLKGATVLGIISVAGGYYTALGAHVYEWLARPLGDEELPAQILRDRSREVLQEYMQGTDQRIHHVMHCELELVFKLGTDQALIRKGIADVQKALNLDRTLGGLAMDIMDEGDEVSYADQEEKIVSGAKVLFGVRYSTNKFTED